MSTDTVAKASEQWKWGVCGFVSTLSALQAKGVLNLEAITATQENHLQLVFILTNDFLTWCSTTNGPLFQQIKAFTATFDGCDATSVQSFMNLKAPPEPKPQQKTAVALPPEGVTAFFHYVTRSQNTSVVSRAYLDAMAEAKANTILGLARDPTTNLNDATFGGLRHWVYASSATQVYTWGKMKSLSDIMPNPYTKILYTIHPG